MPTNGLLYTDHPMPHRPDTAHAATHAIHATHADSPATEARAGLDHFSLTTHDPRVNVNRWPGVGDGTTRADRIVSGPVTCCRSSEATDARLTTMGDPATYGMGHPSGDAPAVLRVTLDPGATLPSRSHAGDAGLDLWPIAGTLPRLMPHETRVFDTGVHVEIPMGYVGKIEGRSGLASRGICPSGGILDNGYRGPVGVVLTNHGQAQWVAEPGRAIAQLVILKCELMSPMVVDSLGSTDRGANGFGSTDRR